MEKNEEKRDAIIAEHPLLYPENFFFEFKDGWLDLIEELSDNLEALIRDYIKRFPGDELPMCVQAKEKHGTLRFCLNLGTTRMWEEIDEAEVLSRTICEICGRRGELRPGGKRFSVRCNKHMNT